MPRRAAKVDGNQWEIVEGLRRIGAGVRSIASVGHGLPDLLVGYRGRNFLLECKDPSQPKSKRKLTVDQEYFVEGWPGQVAVVETLDEAIRAVMNGRAIRVVMNGRAK